MSNDWKNIWDKKYLTNAPSYIMDGFDNLSISQWEHLVDVFCSLIQIDENSDILDIGCGSGAFLEQIKKYNSLSGIDYSENAISVIKNNLEGRFQVAEAKNIPFEDNLFNTVICFSVFYYFNSKSYAIQIIKEMLRVCKPGGQIFIGDVNDSSKRDLYNSLRKKEGRLKNSFSPKHLFYDKIFFIEIAKKNKIHIQIIDEDKLDLPFYSNSQYRYSVIYTI